jgi:hypothetical protein
LKAGGVSEREPSDQFYGDRSAGVTDFAGNQWWIHTHIEDVPHEEIKKRAEVKSSGAADPSYSSLTFLTSRSFVERTRACCEPLFGR